MLAFERILPKQMDGGGNGAAPRIRSPIVTGEFLALSGIDERGLRVTDRSRNVIGGGDPLSVDFSVQGPGLVCR